MKKHIFHYEKQKQQQTPVFDKSTAYNGSTENQEEHPSFPKPKDNLIFELGVLSVCAWIAIALVSAKLNIMQGDLKPHTWLVLDFFAAFLIMFWSAICGAYVFDRDFKYWIIKWSLWWSCIVLFASSIMYMAMFFVELFKNNH